MQEVTVECTTVDSGVESLLYAGTVFLCAPCFFDDKAAKETEEKAPGAFRARKF